MTITVIYNKGDEKFSYTALDARAAKVMAHRGEKEITLAAESIFEAMNGAVAKGGDYLRLRTVPANGTEGLFQTVRVLELMPGSSRKTKEANDNYAEQLNAKLPVLATPFALAQVGLDLDGGSPRGERVNTDVYQLAMNVSRKTIEYVRGMRLETDTALFTFDISEDEKSAPVKVKTKDIKVA